MRRLCTAPNIAVTSTFYVTFSPFLLVQVAFVAAVADALMV